MEIDRAVERGDKDDKAGAKRQRSAGHPVHAAEGDPIGVPEIREEENQPGEDLQGRTPKFMEKELDNQIKTALESSR